jgi:hypothetical protein
MEREIEQCKRREERMDGRKDGREEKPLRNAESQNTFVASDS